MFLNKLSVFLIVIISGTVICQTPPEWPTSYQCEGTIDIPYADIEEPFQAWYDTETRNSRIDFYYGTAKIFQLGETGFGQNLRIVPITTEQVNNQITCFVVNGTVDNQIGPQSVLPLLEGFVLSGTFEDIEEWTLNVVEGEKVNNYSMRLRYNDDGVLIPIRIRSVPPHLRLCEENEGLTGLPFPLLENPLELQLWKGKRAFEPSLGFCLIVKEYTMNGYNTLLGSHYDQYRIHYKSFTPTLDATDIFNVGPEGEHCREYPDGDDRVNIINPIAEFVRPERTEHVEHQFNAFKAKHSKKYETDHEHSLRLEIFRQNIRYIESFNRQNKGYTLAVNHLADKTYDELNYLRGSKSRNGYNGGLPFPYTNIADDDYPETFDWRLYGAVNGVKDQAICGSCWSFAAVGAVEGALFLKTGELVRLSEQALVDCSWGFGNNGCNGGYDFTAYQWIIKHKGIPRDADYGRYLGEDGLCHGDKVRKVARLSGYVNVTVNAVDALKLAIFKHGPVSISIDANHKSFVFYSKGVFYEEACGNGVADLDHGVLAVGYGRLNGEEYWLVKNSWSTHWGDGGYILMSTRDNNCGVLTAPTYVTLE